MVTADRFRVMTHAGQSIVRAPGITRSRELSQPLRADLVRTVALTPLAAAFLTIAQLGVVVIARMFFSGEGRLAFRRTR
jgi:hypothetical protein